MVFYFREVALESAKVFNEKPISALKQKKDREDSLVRQQSQEESTKPARNGGENTEGDQSVAVTPSAGSQTATRTRAVNEPGDMYKIRMCLSWTETGDW